jgi:Ca2+-binding EF-hand superfamily protein
VFCIPLYALYRYRIGQQERRIKDKFIRGIAKNMSIAPSAGAISRDKLVEEFQRIDKDKGGTIEKAGKSRIMNNFDDIPCDKSRMQLTQYSLQNSRTG